MHGLGPGRTGVWRDDLGAGCPDMDRRRQCGLLFSYIQGRSIPAIGGTLRSLAMPVCLFPFPSGLKLWGRTDQRLRILQATASSSIGWDRRASVSPL